MSDPLQQEQQRATDYLRLRIVQLEMRVLQLEQDKAELVRRMDELEPVLQRHFVAEDGKK